MISANGNGNGSGPLGLTKKDFSSDQETRWCPGCGDYAILATVQQFLPELGLPPERIVFVPGLPKTLMSSIAFRTPRMFLVMSESVRPMAALAMSPGFSAP